MRTTRFVVVGLIIVLGSATAAIAPGDVFSQQPPSDRARGALAALSAPSVPGPLEGSIKTDENVYFYAGPCADIIDNYLAASAPLPPGASVSQTEAGIVVVETSFRTSAVIAGDRQDGCSYQIVTAPTVETVGGGPIPSLRTFGSVGCYGIGPDRTALAPLTIDGIASVVFVSPGESGPELGVTQGTVADFAALVEGSAIPGQRWPATIEEGEGNAFTAIATIDGATVAVSFTCTTSAFEMMGIPT